MSMDFPKSSRFWILGINFLHNYYTIFDQENKKIGFTVSKSSIISDSIRVVGEATNENEEEEGFFWSMASFTNINEKSSNEVSHKKFFTIVTVLISVVVIYLVVIFVLFIMGKIGVKRSTANRDASVQLLGSFS